MNYELRIMNIKNIKILDIKIDVISKSEVLDKIKELLTTPVPINRDHASLKRRGLQLVTTNPEFILAAQNDKMFKNIINNSWLSVADGYGLRLASKYLSLTCSPSVSSPRDPLVRTPAVNDGNRLKNFFIGLKVAWWGIVRSKKLDVVREIITGTDLVLEIIKELRIKNQELRIFLLGGYGNTPSLTAENLKKQNPNLQIYYSVFETENIVEKINNFKPDILFVALNHPRAQKWIDENLAKMPSVKLAMGVGGAFDYISGKIKRAPHNMQHSFEWLFRLFCQPKRLKRIWQASVIFPWKVFISSTRL